MTGYDTTGNLLDHFLRYAPTKNHFFVYDFKLFFTKNGKLGFVEFDDLNTEKYIDYPGYFSHQFRGTSVTEDNVFMYQNSTENKPSPEQIKTIVEKSENNERMLNIMTNSTTTYRIPLKSLYNIEKKMDLTIDKETNYDFLNDLLNNNNARYKILKEAYKNHIPGKFINPLDSYSYLTGKSDILPFLLSDNNTFVDHLFLDGDARQINMIYQQKTYKIIDSVVNFYEYVSGNCFREQYYYPDVDVKEWYLPKFFIVTFNTTDEYKNVIFYYDKINEMRKEAEKNNNTQLFPMSVDNAYNNELYDIIKANGTEFYTKNKLVSAKIK